MTHFLGRLALLAVAALPLAANAQSDSAYPSGRNGVTLAAGTEIAIQTNENIDSRNARVGQTYPAEVAQDVMGPSGEVLIPKGSEARLTIRQANEGSTTGSADLALDLESVNVAGRQYTISSEDVRKGGSEGIGKNKRTAEMVGGGAVLGTLLGAIAGGGKGAAIGAVAGAAAGGTAQVLTKGKDVKVPAETILKFKLDRPLHLRSVSSY